MDTVVQYIRQKAMELAISGPCKFFTGKESETGEFDIDFSFRGFFGKANIRISRINDGYVSIISLRITGREHECFWDRQFFDKDGHHLTRRTRFVEKNHTYSLGSEAPK